MAAVSGMGVSMCMCLVVCLSTSSKNHNFKRKNTSDVQCSVRYTRSNVSSYIACYIHICVVASGPGIFWEHTQSLARIMSFSSSSLHVHTNTPSILVPALPVDFPQISECVLDG